MLIIRNVLSQRHRNGGLSLFQVISPPRCSGFLVIRFDLCDSSYLNRQTVEFNKIRFKKKKKKFNFLFCIIIIVLLGFNLRSMFFGDAMEVDLVTSSVQEGGAFGVTDTYSNVSFKIIFIEL